MASELGWRPSAPPLRLRPAVLSRASPSVSGFRGRAGCESGGRGLSALYVPSAALRSPGAAEGSGSGGAGAASRASAPVGEALVWERSSKGGCCEEKSVCSSDVSVTDVERNLSVAGLV